MRGEVKNTAVVRIEAASVNPSDVKNVTGRMSRTTAHNTFPNSAKIRGTIATLEGCSLLKRTLSAAKTQMD
jgi:hypothetical protein